jgi:type IV secretory pathway TraG/TraD family ATPase VirD4
VLCFAPTRSGKGVGLVIPTLLTWPESPSFTTTKARIGASRPVGARCGRVLLFDPTNPDSSAFNPLLEVRRGDTEIRDVQNVADILVDPEGALERRNHWEMARDNDLHVRIGRIRDRGADRRPKLFVGRVLASAQKAGGLYATRRTGTRSTFGRGRPAASSQAAH